MRNYMFILGIFLLWGCSPIQKLYNNFSDFKEVKQYSDRNTPIRIFFDRQGYLYSSQPLNSREFKEEQSVLKPYFIKHEDELKKVFAAEGLSYAAGDDASKNIEILQNHLREQYITEINVLSAGKRLIYLIHGYNNTGESASVALEKLRVEVIKKYPQEKFQFVEVYWDGLTKRNNSLNSVKIWDNAQYSSARAGLGLRRILNSIKNSESYVITHSHGAGVITEALFNVRRFDESFYTNDESGIEIAKLQAAHNTPTSKFIVGMLAPAIPGNNVFDEYYERTVAGRPTSTKMSNYRFINGFNRYDIATTKGIFSGYFGATTLACNEEEHRVVAERFNNDTSVYSRTDFSADKKNKQRSHAVAQYIANPSFNLFLGSVIR